MKDSLPETTEMEVTGFSEDRKWQERLLPLMSKMIVVLAVFFFLASLIQLIYLHISIEKEPKKEIAESFKGLSESSQLTFEENLETARFKAIIMLEANALGRRHHQANVLLMSRVWARYLGFVTGMILALVGAVFILGKLREPGSEVNAKTEVMAFSLKSASPGIILAVLGVSLMLTTIITHHEISITDVPVYITGEGLAPAKSKHGGKPKLVLPKSDSAPPLTSPKSDDPLSK
ncbi:MAG: hypothetical protein KAU41_06945 [Deltaproteobacteria bacterium]|jgi:hypothetical protein|nr:hypothetical protein [Deltaproteobacteria bacterium]